MTSLLNVSLFDHLVEHGYYNNIYYSHKGKFNITISRLSVQIRYINIVLAMLDYNIYIYNIICTRYITLKT